MSNKVKKVCKTCGSDNVWKDANARFNTATQEYELLNIFDAEYCEDCDGDTEIIEEPLNAPDFKAEATPDQTGA